MLPRSQIQKIASEVIREHGTGICNVLNEDSKRRDGSGFSGGNIMALMEIFAEKLDVANPAAKAAERARFEKWLDETMGLQSEWDEPRNCYKEFPAHLAWKAWNATKRLD